MEYINTLPSDEESCYHAEHLEFQAESYLHPFVSDDDLAAVLPHCPNVTSARLNGIRDLSSRTLILLAQHADELTHLDVSGCSDVTDLGLKAVATYATSLRALLISRVFSTTDAAIRALVRGLPHLEELDMDMLPLVTALATRDIWTYAKKLRRWSLAGCKNVTDSGFPWTHDVDVDHDDAALQGSHERDRYRSWMETLPPLVLPPIYKLGDLRFLDASHCARLTDAAVFGIVAHAPRIAHLNLAGCIKLSNSAMYRLCELGEHLVEIDVAGLEKVTDAGMYALTSACPRLRSVDISFMPRLTDLTVLALASLPRLERLAAAGLPKLTDQAAFFLSEHASALEHLHFSYCVRLTLDGVQALLRRLTKLQSLSLSGVPALQRRGIRRFADRPHEVSAYQAADSDAPTPTMVRFVNAVSDGPRSSGGRSRPGSELWYWQDVGTSDAVRGDAANREGAHHDSRNSKQGMHRVFRRQNIRALCAFLEKEEWRRREAERLNILFEPRGDDSRALY